MPTGKDSVLSNLSVCVVVFFISGTAIFVSSSLILDFLKSLISLLSMLTLLLQMEYNYNNLMSFYTGSIIHVISE